MAAAMAAAASSSAGYAERLECVGALNVEPETGDPPVPHREDVGHVGLDLELAVLASSTRMGESRHVVARLQELLRARLIVTPRLEPAPQVLRDALQAARRERRHHLDDFGVLVQLDVVGAELQHGVEVALIERLVEPAK